MTNKGRNTDGLNTEFCWVTPRLKIMNCIFKRESQTNEGVDYKQKETLCEHTTPFWERLAEWKCQRLEMAQGFFLYDMDDIRSQASTRLLQPMSERHLKVTVSYQHLLRPSTSLLSFSLEEERGGFSLPLSDQLPDSHSKHWPSERSYCLSPLGPCK